jgi:antirestriction protein
MTDTPRVYIADLAAYNAGYLHGIWVDATDDISDIQEQVNAMLVQSPVGDSEEIAIHDYEGFGGLELSEYDGLDSVHELALFIEEHGTLGAAVLDHQDGDIERATDTIENHYAGCYESVADYAEQVTEDTTEIPPSLQSYIDYDRMGQDLEFSGDVFTIETGFQEVHVFYTH